MSCAAGIVFSFGYHRWADPHSGRTTWPNHRMAMGLVQDLEIPDLLVVDAFRSRLSYLRGHGRGWDQGFPHGERRRLAHPQRWRRFDPFNPRQMIHSYRHLDTWLAARSRSMTMPILVTCHPVHAAIADRSTWSDVVYYGWDDWRSYPPYATARSLLDWSYREMAKRDTHVIGVSNVILERVGARRGTVVPNATTAAEYASLPEPPSWFGQLPTPLAFYAGSLENRVDIPAVIQAARDLPEWTFCMVGPVRGPDVFAESDVPSNLVIRPPVTRAEVLAMAARAQVCLIPHRRTEMSESMSPLKLYEYVGAGAPVVATDLPPIRGFGDRVLLVEPGEPFAPAIERAVAMAPIGPTELGLWRAQNDWSARYIAFRAAVLSRT